MITFNFIIKVNTFDLPYTDENSREWHVLLDVQGCARDGYVTFADILKNYDQEPEYYFGANGFKKLVEDGHIELVEAV